MQYNKYLMVIYLLVILLLSTEKREKEKRLGGSAEGGQEKNQDAPESPQKETGPDNPQITRGPGMTQPEAARHYKAGHQTTATPRYMQPADTGPRYSIVCSPIKINPDVPGPSTCNRKRSGSPGPYKLKELKSSAPLSLPIFFATGTIERGPVG